MTISVLQEVQTSIGGTGQTTLTQSVTFTAGSTALVFCGGPSGTSHTITDSVNGATGWSSIAGLTTVGGGGIRVFKRDSMTAGATTITDTYGASTAFTGIWVAEIGSTSGYDVNTTINVQSSGATHTSGNGTPTTQPGLCFGFMYNDTQTGTVAGTAGSGFTLGMQNWDFGTGRTFAVSENLRYTSTTAIPATFTPSGATDTTGTVAIFFKEATAGASLALGTGFYSLTGSAATLATGGVTNDFFLLCNAGSYTYQGALANSDLETALAQGSYALTGSAATFSQASNNFSLALGTGTYAYVGFNAALTATVVSVPGGGSMMMLFGKRKR